MNSNVLDKYFPIILKNHPQLKETDIKVFEDGHDHYVFLVEGNHVFRFPRTDAHGKNDEVENIFSREFAKVSPVRVQEVTGHVDQDTGMKYQTYEFIHGKQLSRDFASTLTKDELISIGKDMGRFLKALHSFPVARAREMNMNSLVSSEDYGQWFKLFNEKNRVNTFLYLTNEEQQWVEKLVSEFVSLTERYPFDLKVTHSDMLPEHFIVDENTHKLNGIIDLAGRIADPANDFKFFDRYGDDFLKSAYETYLPVDEYFDKRRSFYAGNLPVANLFQSIERKDNSMIDIHVTQLKEYIATHPLR